MASEHQEQAALFEWSCYHYGLYPEFELGFWAIPNGQYRPGQRMESGTKKGVPDIQIAVARSGYHGFFGELKVGKGRLSKHQKKVIEFLRQQRYYVAVEWGWEAMASKIEWYMELDKGD